MLQPLQNNSQKAQVAKSSSVMSPVKGWNAKDSLADMDEGYAVELENFFPDLTDCKLRGGYESHSTGNGSDAVESLHQWAGITSNKLISAAGGSLYDATSEGVATSIDSGKSNDRWQSTMFGTVAGNYLYLVNGADDPIYYDGSAMVTPSLTGVTSTDIIGVLTHQMRLFFTFNNSLEIGYLPVVSLSGNISTFNIGGLCKKGGYVMACGSWTRDGGSGPDDVFVAITSEGECVLYSGNDPSSAISWNLVGVFSVGKPIGRRCIEKIGSELIVTTQDGVVPLSVFLPIDQLGARSKALSDSIQNDFITSARLYGSNFGWQSVHYPQGSYALFNIPVSGIKSIQYVVNTQTGAWCKFVGQNASCWALLDGDLYFGGISGGVVYKADTGTSDNGSNIDWKIRPAFSYLGAKGTNKLVSMCRPHFTSNGSPSFSIDLNVDFSNKNPTSIPTAAPLQGALWGVAVWGQDVWSGIQQISEWVTISGFGDAVSPTIRGADKDLRISFSAYDMIWQQGNVL